jgi:small acid-soluble spore protein E (minor gamma-type SASP)
MANFNKQQPNKTQAGTNIQEVRQQNAQSAGTQGQFGTEFAGEFAASKTAQAAKGQFGAEFASETNATEVKQQNQQAEARKSQNAVQMGKTSK